MADIKTKLQAAMLSQVKAFANEQAAVAEKNMEKKGRSEYSYHAGMATAFHMIAGIVGMAGEENGQ